MEKSYINKLTHIFKKKKKKKKEVAVGERIAYWIRTPQIPGSRPGWYGTFY